MRLALAFLFLAFAGCSTAPQGYVSVPVMPVWEAPAVATTCTAVQVQAECARLAPFAIVELSDTTFTPVSHAWLERAMLWSWEFGKVTGLGTYTAESWDCDKFAAAFALAANVATQRAHVQAQPLMARIHVRQVAAFGGVPAGGAHALNGFLSDRGFFVYEPQTRTLVPLAQYPNRDAIFRIKLGG